MMDQLKSQILKKYIASSWEWPSTPGTSTQQHFRCATKQSKYLISDGYCFPTVQNDYIILSKSPSWKLLEQPLMKCHNVKNASSITFRIQLIATAPWVALFLEIPTELRSVWVVKTPIAPPKKCWKKDGNALIWHLMQPRLKDKSTATCNHARITGFSAHNFQIFLLHSQRL